ncbi:SPOR domain-containing protein [Sphingomonadaceae bacterium jetA1]|uniref:SPOR domain-containing protein n=1 Tax=Facivitalis istanbulensis TaxID=3075838 RepID=UPI00348AFAAF
MRRFATAGAALIAVVASLTAMPASADVKAGVDAWARGDFRQAVEEWRGPAVAGDADAQFNLGQAYKLGRGVPVDPTLAESWFRKAAAQGHVQAADNYGLALFQAGKKTEALPWLEKSVAHGEPRAQLVLGTMLFNGDGVPRDNPRAYALMTLASESGLKSASETLTQMDQYVTPAERARGVAMAQQMKVRLTSMAATPGNAPVATRPPATVKPVPLPPSTPARPGYGASYATPGARTDTAQTDATPQLSPRTAAPKTAVPRPAAARPERPVAKHPAQGANTGPWRIQLGAFRDRGNAEALWAKVRGRLGGARPAFVAAGGVTRLQAGGYANRTEAEAACRRSGQSCVVVAP